MKPKIIKIQFSKEDQNIIDKINKGELVPTVRTVTDKKTGVKKDIITHRFTFEMGIKKLREMYGGICRCGAWPLYKIMYDVGDDKQGAWLVERYCQPCFEKMGIKK